MRTFFSIGLIGCFLTVSLGFGCTTAAPSTPEPVAATATPVTTTGCVACPASHACASCVALKDQGGCRACQTGAYCASCDVVELPGAQVREGQPVATVAGRGMSCPMCGAHAQKTLGRLDGIEWVDINLQTGDIYLGLKDDAPRPAPQTLEQAVRDAGFTPGRVNLPPAEATP